MGFSRKWRPSASQRREFANNMKDPAFSQAYYARKAAKAEKRRAGSKFDYESAGGEYVPTKEQHDFALRALLTLSLSPGQEDACNIVASGYSTGMKVHHDYIHVVNELRRS